VAFDSTARTLAPLTALGEFNSASRAKLRQKLDQLGANGGTDIRRGLTAAAALSQGSADWVLLSDGMDKNWQGRSDAVPAGVRVHTIALSAKADRAALSRLSAQTGGIAEIAQSAADLPRIVSSLFGEAAGDEVLLVADGTLKAGESATFPVDIDAGQRAAELRLSWPGSDMDLSATAPDGTVYTTDAAVQGGFGVKAKTYDIIRLKSPPPGRWQVVARGVRVAPQGEPYALRVAGRGGALQTAWVQNVTVPEVGQPFTLDLKGGHVDWEQANATTWLPDGRVVQKEKVLSPLGAMLGSGSGQTIYALVPKRPGAYRVQIVAHGTDTSGSAVMRSIDRTFRVAVPGRGIGRGSSIDPFIRRGAE
jgi:hypothetical protein